MSSSPEIAQDEELPDYGPEPVTEQDKASTVQRLAAMTVPEKINAAMKGTREMRAILIRDANKRVAQAVLSSPKLTDSEVEGYARLTSLGEDVLRTIGQTRAWTKNYAVMHALVKNAKTPIAVSLSLLQRLNEADVRRVSINRNVPEPLRMAARRKLVG